MSLRGFANLFGLFKTQGAYSVRLFSAVYTILDALDIFNTRLRLRSESGDSEQRIYSLKRGDNPYAYLRHKCFRNLSIKEIELLRWNFYKQYKDARRSTERETKQFVSESGDQKGMKVDFNTECVNPASSMDESESLDLQSFAEEKLRDSSMPEGQFECEKPDQLSLISDQSKIIKKLEIDVATLINSLSQIREEMKWSRAYNHVSGIASKELKYDRTLRNVFAVYFNIEGKYAYGAKQNDALYKTPGIVKFLRVKCHIPPNHIGKKVTIAKGSFIDAGTYADSTGLMNLK